MNEIDAELPCASMAVQVTLAFPSANVLPDGGEHVTGRAPSTRSIAANGRKSSHVITIAPLVLMTSAETLPGPPLTTGGVVSRTVTVNVLGADVLPAASVAVQVTVVIPSANVEPDAG